MADKYRNFGKKSKFQLIDAIKERDNRITHYQERQEELHKEIDDLKAENAQLKETLSQLHKIGVK